MPYNIAVKNNNTESLNIFLKNRDKGTWMVLYYSEWCGHCREMAPYWDKLVSQKININFVKIDDGMLSSLDYEHNVIGYPTIEIFKNGNKISSFESIRTYENLYNYALKYSSKDKKMKGKSSKKRHTNKSRNKKRKSLKRKRRS